jgi:replicative DNA helicase
MLLHDERTERRLFGAILAEPGVLEQCQAVETDDFSDLHLKFAFAAIRNLQARGEAVGWVAVEADLERQGYVQVDAFRLAETLFEPAYRDEGLVRIDARWLRRLANRRSNA